MPLVLAAAAKSSVHLDLSAGVWVLIAAVLLLPTFVVPGLYVFLSTRRAKAAAHHPSSSPPSSPPVSPAVTDEVASGR